MEPSLFSKNLKTCHSLPRLAFETWMPRMFDNRVINLISGDHRFFLREGELGQFLPMMSWVEAAAAPSAQGGEPGILGSPCRFSEFASPQPPAMIPLSLWRHWSGWDCCHALINVSFIIKMAFIEPWQLRNQLSWWWLWLPFSNSICNNQLWSVWLGITFLIKLNQTLIWDT